MSGRRDAARRLGALAGAALGAAACVEITTAEQGVLSIRFEPLPPSIVAGDTLRDSTGRVQRLRAVAFGESGDTVTGATFVFAYLPTAGDTAGGGRALRVDSVTGLVRADTLPRTAAARISASFGRQLQALDTIAIVRKPTRLSRVGPASVALPYLCIDSSRALLVDTLQFGTASPPLGVRLYGDSGSAATDSVPVPSYLVEYRIVAPAQIPTGTVPYGDVRPALYLTNGRVDRPLRFDTTNVSGQTTTALRVVGPLLTPTSVPGDSVVVEAQAFYRGAPVDTAVRFRVRLTRVPRAGQASCP
ncbi:hypothetical protein [Roseisolibacter sp. H3M3-2]|uniref:hypothetical protein n=1 Tax=Roseisolibacter sp. H3M3-2 TaxID=3031323 RepID=UPI0023DB88E9|nr:hypothetical protein [Roseisolibacter sp. H3M3-2]MDF1505356.1 hypothetical protein [Roseisolibacter sp. H3M3-2]